MKVAVWYNLPSGGAKRALYDHVQGLLAQGHQVESWCPPAANQTYLPLNKIIKEHVVPLESFGDGSGSFATNLRYRLDVGRRFQAMEAHCAGCCQQMEERKMDVLFANTCALFAVSPIGRLSKLPKLLYLQEPNRALFEAAPKLRWAALDDTKAFPRGIVRKAKDIWQVQSLRYYVREEIKNARSYDRILVNSFFSRESVLRAYGLESTVCYLGVNSDLFFCESRPAKFQFVSVGSLLYSKGADRCIQALASLPASMRPDLVWIGNGFDRLYRENIEQMAQKLGVTFSFRNNVSDTELILILNESLAMLYMPRLEPFGYAPLEANSCGLPVIALAEGGIRETVEDGVNGYLAASADPKEMAHACLRLLENPQQTTMMRETVCTHVRKHWNLEESNRRLEENLKDILSSPESPR